MNIQAMAMIVPESGTYRSELTLERIGKSVLPSLDLVLELGRGDGECLRSDVYGLDAKLVGEEHQRSGKV